MFFCSLAWTSRWSTRW